MDTGFIYHRGLKPIDVINYFLTSDIKDIKTIDKNLIKKLEEQLGQKYIFDKKFFYITLPLVFILYIYTIFHSNILDIIVSIFMFAVLKIDLNKPTIEFDFDGLVRLIIFWSMGIGIIVFGPYINPSNYIADDTLIDNINLYSNIYPVTLIFILTFIFNFFCFI